MRLWSCAAVSAVFAAAVSVGAVGCDSAPHAAASAASSSPSASRPVVVESVEPGAPSLAVPGGAPVSPSPGSHAACTTVADADALRTLAASIGEFTAERAGGSESESPAGARLRADAAQLRVLASGIDLAGVPDRLRTLADALDALTAPGGDTKDTVDRLSAALQDLGEAVQSQCHFVIG